MKTITQYILKQVAANRLSHEEAKIMLLELQKPEVDPVSAGRPAGAASQEMAGGVSQEMAGAASPKMAGTISQEMAEGASSKMAGAISQEIAEGASSKMAGGVTAKLARAISQEMAEGASSKMAGAISQEMAEATSSEVAIIGMAGRFPKAENIGEYWRHLIHGDNCIDHFPEARRKDYLDQCAQSGYARLLTDFTPAETEVMADDLYVKGGFLPEVDKFDPAFFRIPLREAMFMDPLQRVFLETAYEALEDAGYGGKKMYGANVGVFVGKDHTAPTMYRYLTEPDPLSLTGSWTGILASRIAYLYNWRGPSMVIDTACSSGLVAIHEACRALQHHDCEVAIAGGIHLQLFPIKKGSNLVMNGVESRDSQVRTFDKDAAGTVWGEGAGALILKPLSKATADGDHIYAVIKGSAVNNDGASNGITAPNAEAQKEVILRAWKEAKIHPETLSYIEAHGTGTNLGDPIEIKGLTSAFREHTTKKQFCAIGSVKANVGHLVAASGLASVIKVVLAMKNRQLPPSINFSTPNPYINFGESPVYVNDRLRFWEPGEGIPRRAGVSSFGFSGTNCHLVLEEAPKPDETEAIQPPGLPWILTLSARGENELAALLAKYDDFLSMASAVDLGNICYTANTGRGHYDFRLALAPTDLEDLKQKIGKLRRGDFDIAQEPEAYTRVHPTAADQTTDQSKNGLTETERRRLSSVAAQEIREFIELTRTNPGNRGGAFSEFAARLCRLYIQGADIVWDDLYRGQNLRRVSLPTYPLERIKCWAEPNRVIKEGLNLSQKPLHPLIHQLQFESFDLKAFHTVFSVKTHWVLEEHRLLDYHILPGTAYLEMARVATEAYYGAGPVEFRDLIFANPFVADPTESKIVQTIIKKQTGYLEFIMSSKTGPTDDGDDGSWVIHARGKVYQAGPAALMGHNPQELRRRLAGVSSPEITGASSHNDFGSSYGPRWRGIIETVAGGDEALIHLQLPEKFQADLRDYYLHPALMDQAVNAFGLEILNEPYLPFVYQKLTVYDRLPANFYSYIRRKSTGADNPHTSAREVITMDIVLMDESGRVLAEIGDYSIKKVHAKELEVQQSPRSHDYYGFQWRPAALGAVAQPPEATTAGSILVFKDQRGIAGNVIRMLQDSGRDVIEVAIGSGYRQVNQNQFFIQGEKNDYHRLLSEVKDRQISQILHCMTMTDRVEPQNMEELECQLSLGLYSLFYLVRALMENEFPKTVDLVLISDNVQEVTGNEVSLNPHHGAFFGLGKGVGLENARLKCRAIDLDDETVVEKILMEILSTGSTYQVAFRRNQRFVEEFRRLELKPGPEQAIQDSFAIQDVGAIQDGGVYVITGGTGAIGLEIGKYLAARGKVKLALIQRRSLPGRKVWEEVLRRNEDRKLVAQITAIREMEATGSEVSLYRVDVSNESELNPVLEELRHKYGRINGVIHAAGIPGDGFLIKKDMETFKRTVSPKIQGTWLLDKLTAADHLDFFILFSSITTMTGGPGQSDYTAANAYLDTFAAARNRRGQRTIAIDWPLWNGTGMAADYRVTDENLIFKGLSTQKALAIFGEILQSSFTKKPLEQASPMQASPEKSAPEEPESEQAAPEKPESEQAAPEKPESEQAAPEKPESEQAAPEKPESEQATPEKPESAEAAPAWTQAGAHFNARVIPGELNYQVIVSANVDLPFEIADSIREAIKKQRKTRHTVPSNQTALPEPGQARVPARVDRDVEYVAPGDEIERTLALLWQEVLGVERVGTLDNFFELGGDSLKAFQLIEKANQGNLNLSIADIFTANTIAGLADLIRREKAGSGGELAEGDSPIIEEAELIPVQSCFFERQFPQPHYWNLSFMIYSREGFDAAILHRVFAKIVEHHDALRMAFRKTAGGTIIQSIRGLNEKLFDLTVLDFTDQPDLERQIELESARIQGSLDLEKGPLVKAGLFKTDQGDHLLLVTHHLVIDGESLGILLEDLRTGYIQAVGGMEIQLPRKTASFLEWARRLHDYGRSDQILQELDYWRKIDETRVAPLPKDHMVTDRRFQFSQIVSEQLPEEDSARLLNMRPYELSIREALLIAFGLALQEWTGEERALVRVIGQGRDLGLGGLNLTRTIGWLSISYPVILAPGPSGDLGARIRRMRDELRGVPGNGAGYDILRYITLPLNETLPPFTARSEIIFNFMGLVNVDQGKDDLPFGQIEKSPLSMGFMKSPESPKEYTMDVTSYITGGKFTVNLDYNRLEYEEATMRNLARLFLGNLRRILNSNSPPELLGRFK